MDKKIEGSRRAKKKKFKETHKIVSTAHWKASSCRGAKHRGFLRFKGLGWSRRYCCNSWARTRCQPSWLVIHCNRCCWIESRLRILWTKTSLYLFLGFEGCWQHKISQQSMLFGSKGMYGCSPFSCGHRKRPICKLLGHLQEFGYLQLQNPNAHGRASREVGVILDFKDPKLVV